MELNPVERLKTSGNEAFKNGQYDKAEKFYEEAIQMEKLSTNDSKKLAVLYANSSQVQIKQAKFKEAVLSASTSLKYDPTFKKSLLRRGIAYFEMKDYGRAADDLHTLLKLEPNNTDAIEYLLQMVQPNRMKNSLCRAYVGHVLRRAFSTYASFFASQPASFPIIFNKIMLRVSFLSSRLSQTVMERLSGAVIGERLRDSHAVSLPPWFTAKRMKCGTLDINSALVIFSRQILDLIFKGTRPGTLSLMIDEDFSTLDLYPHYKFDSVYGMMNFLPERSIPGSKFVQQFGKVSTMVTSLSYFNGVSTASIPNVRVLSIPVECIVGSKFVKRWSVSSWKIEKLIFQECNPNLSSFKNFKGVVSQQLIDLYFSLAESVDEFFEVHKLTDLFDDLNVLKRCFPNLNNFVGIIKHELPDTDNLEECSAFLARYLTFSARMFGSLQIGWCSNPKIFVTFASGSEGGSSIDLKKLSLAIGKAVENFRNERSDFEFIRLHGPSSSELEHTKTARGYAMIQMKANGIHFEISFLHTQ